MPGTLCAELIDEIKPNKDVRLDPEVLFGGDFQEIGRTENVHYRPRWGAFHNTPLEAKLREQEITTLVICGFSFSTGGRASSDERRGGNVCVVRVDRGGRHVVKKKK